MAALRQTLDAEAGIPDLEADLVDPSLPGFAKRAAEIFHRDGFVIVKVRSRLTPGPPLAAAGRPRPPPSGPPQVTAIKQSS